MFCGSSGIFEIPENDPHIAGRLCLWQTLRRQHKDELMAVVQWLGSMTTEKEGCSVRNCFLWLDYLVMLKDIVSESTKCVYGSKHASFR